MIKTTAFADADYRRLWAGCAFNQQGGSGEQVILGLLAFQVAQSTAWVGVVMAVYFLPFFVFGMLSGVLSDRMDRRGLLRGIELSIMANKIIFSMVLALGLTPPSLIIVFALAAGSLRALHEPVKISYAYDIVGGEKIVAGLGLLNLGSRAGQLVGALFAGFVTEWIGVSAALLTLAAGHAIAAALFFRLSQPGMAAVDDPVPIRQNLGEYFTELRTNKIFLMLIAVTASVEVFGFSFSTALPELATTRLDFGAEGLGLLHAARSLGGIVAGLMLVTLGTFQRRGAAYIGVIFAFGGSLILLSIDSPPWALLAVVVLIAALAAASDILTQSMMQLSVPNALRGRAMGMWVLAIGFAPVGHLEIGALAASLGVGPALLLNGVALVAIGFVISLAVPNLRRL